MPDAFVNIVIEREAAEATDAIADAEGVAAAHHVLGKFDAVAELDLEDPGSLQRVVTGLIQDVGGVEETTTVVSPELASHHTPETDRATPDR
jgi:DNA-binding Lrp family transcriptional regulator